MNLDLNCKKKLGKKKILGKKNPCPENLALAKLWIQKNLIQKVYWSKKILSQKKFWVKEKFSPNEIRQK